MSIHIGEVKIESAGPLFLIAGPCVIESEEQALRHARFLKHLCEKLDIPLIFKSSYDKANRTSLSSFRGPGLKKGLVVLQKVKKQVKVPVLTDIHHPHEAGVVAEVADCLQIPAFLCRQTDLLVAAARTGRAVNIKKGQFVAPWDMGQAVEKVRSAGNRNVLLTERGTMFGYNNLVVDFRGLDVMKRLGCPVVFDATHSVQLPSAGKGVSAGQREYVGALSRAAVAAGCCGIFLEVHENPDQAPCDGPNMIALKDLEGLLKTLKKIDQIITAQKLKSPAL